MSESPPKYVLLRDGTLLEQRDETTYTVAQSTEEVDNLLESIGLSIEIVPKKERLTMMVDASIMDYFKSFGARYQTRINAVLRSFVETKHRTKEKPGS